MALIAFIAFMAFMVFIAFMALAFPGLCHDFLALFEIREPELVPAFVPHFRVGAADHVAASHGTKFEAECTGLRTNTAAGESP